MKKSEQIRLEAGESDSEIKAFGLDCKAMREERSERFEESILPRLKQLYVVEENAGYIKVDSQKFGMITIYPKANKLCIHKGQQWRKPAVRWIIENLIKPGNGSRACGK